MIWTSTSFSFDKIEHVLTHFDSPPEDMPTSCLWSGVSGVPWPESTASYAHMTHNFCESCNRVRLTCTGTLYMCLGQDDAADLRSVLRSTTDDIALGHAIDEAITRKPTGHDFIIDRRSKKPAVARHMSVTGG